MGLEPTTAWTNNPNAGGPLRCDSACPRGLVLRGAPRFAQIGPPASERSIDEVGLLGAGQVVGVDQRGLEVAMTHPFLRVCIGTPAAAIRVPKVWRRSWTRTRRTPARRSAALKRLSSLERSSGRPVCGGRTTPGRRVRLGGALLPALSGWRSVSSVPAPGGPCPRVRAGCAPSLRRRHRQSAAPQRSSVAPARFRPAASAQTAPSACRSHRPGTLSYPTGPGRANAASSACLLTILRTDPASRLASVRADGRRAVDSGDTTPERPLAAL